MIDLWIKVNIRLDFYSQEQLNCLLVFSGSWELFTLNCLTFCLLFKKKPSSADTKLCALFHCVHSTAATCWCIGRRHAVNEALSCSAPSDRAAASDRKINECLYACSYSQLQAGTMTFLHELSLIELSIISKKRRTSHCKVIPILETPLNLTKAWNTFWLLKN